MGGRRRPPGESRGDPRGRGAGTLPDRVTAPVEFGHWFLPGPAEVHPDILAAMNRPMIAHRGPAMEQLMADLREPLAGLFRTVHPVVIGTASTTGFMEAAI